MTKNKKNTGGMNVFLAYAEIKKTSCSQQKLNSIVIMYYKSTRVEKKRK